MGKKSKIVDPDRRIDIKYPIDDVFAFVSKHIVVTNYLKYKNSKEYRIRQDFDGHMIKPWSLRHFTFMTKGTSCCHCNLEATHFYKERGNENESYHLNLYGTDDNGDEILFTKDHVTPKSKGGKHRLNNFLTMCQPCNTLKDDMTLEEWNLRKGSM